MYIDVNHSPYNKLQANEERIIYGIFMKFHEISFEIWAQKIQDHQLLAMKMLWNEVGFAS